MNSVRVGPRHWVLGLQGSVSTCPCLELAGLCAGGAKKNWKEHILLFYKGGQRKQLLHNRPWSTSAAAAFEIEFLSRLPLISYPLLPPLPCYSCKNKVFLVSWKFWKCEKQNTFWGQAKIYFSFVVHQEFFFLKNTLAWTKHNIWQGAKHFVFKPSPLKKQCHVELKNKTQNKPNLAFVYFQSHTFFGSFRLPLNAVKNFVRSMHILKILLVLP